MNNSNNSSRVVINLDGDLDDLDDDEIIFEDEFDEFAEDDDEDEDEDEPVVGFVGVEIDEVIEEDLIVEDEEDDEFEIDEDLDEDDEE